MARRQGFRRDDAERDADRDRDAELRQYAGGEDLEHGGADSRRARLLQQQAEQAQLGRRGKSRQQQRKRDRPSDPGERRKLGGERARQIGGGFLRERRVVVVAAEPDVALVAKQPAHPPGPMTMIDAEHESGPLADPAGEVLASQQLAVVFVGEPVAASALVGPPMLAPGMPFLFPGFVSLVFLPAVAA
jgi:hypothetical protein